MTRPHGYTRYKLGGCRCYTCSFAVSEYNRLRAERIAAGTWRADTAPLRLHARALMAAGMGYKRIADTAGVSQSTMRSLIFGRTDRGTPPPATTRYDIAQKVLAVRLDLAPGAHIDATGAARRAQALNALGYTLTEIAERIGWTTQNLSKILHSSDLVTVRTAQDLGRVFDELSMRRPVGERADRARGHARRARWFPPLAWDDDTIDDPNALPCVLPPAGEIAPDVDELALQHAAAGHDVTFAMPTRVELVRRLTAAGRPNAEIARIAQTSTKMLSYLRSRHPGAQLSDTFDVAA